MTKTTNGYRDIPLTNEVKRLLDIIRKFNEEHGFNAEWIFQSDKAEYDYRLSYYSTPILIHNTADEAITVSFEWNDEMIVISARDSVLIEPKKLNIRL